MLSKGSIIGSKWKVERQIGEGACAKVYSVNAVGSSTDYDVVAKVIPLAKGKGKAQKELTRICNTLNYEYMLYTGLLIDFPLSPRRPPKFYGDDEALGIRYLVMERLDMDLVSFAKSSPPSTSTIASFGLQILEGLMWLHQKNFVFVDVKPENFMLKDKKIYYVDCKCIFNSLYYILRNISVAVGLVERYVPQATVNARAPGSRSAFAGTPSFCSLSVHRGGIPTGADDVEAMVRRQ